MEKLIIARHCSFDGEFLTPEGNNEAHTLACGLKPYIKESTVHIISSPTGRAIRTGMILEKIKVLLFADLFSLNSWHCALPQRFTYDVNSANYSK